MAPKPGRKPRVRKSAPTIRELAEANVKAAAEPKTARRHPSAAKPLKIATRPLRPVLRLVGRILGWLAPRYFINAWREVKQVTWPGRRETWRLTLAVFVFAIVFGLMIYGVDKVLESIFKKVVLS